MEMGKGTLMVRRFFFLDMCFVALFALTGYYLVRGR